MADNASSSAGPRYSGYDWNKIPEDKELADALTSHRREQQQKEERGPLVHADSEPLSHTQSLVTASQAMVNRDALTPYQTSANERPQWVIDFLNKSAERNVSERRPAARWQLGTLDVLARAQNGLETFDDFEQMDAVRETIKALPNMDNQTEARDLTRALRPLLSNWLKNPTDNKNIKDVDYVKADRLHEFFANMNELKGSNAIGIQRAFYTELPENIFDVFDEALPPDLVQEVTNKIREIGDKLITSPELANDPAALKQILETHGKAEEHYEAAGERRAELGKEEAKNKEKTVMENIAPRGGSSKHEQALLSFAPRGLIQNTYAAAEDAKARDEDPSVLSDDHGDATIRAGVQTTQDIQVHSEFPSETAQALPIRTRNSPRKYLGWLPGTLGTTYPPAFSLSVGETAAPTSHPAQQEPQLPADQDIAEFFVDPSGRLNDIRVKASPENNRGGEILAFTLTDDSNKKKLDCCEHKGNAFAKALLECSSSSSQYWNFTGNATDGWQPNRTDRVRQKPVARILQKILHKADSGERKEKGKEPQSRN